MIAKSAIRFCRLICYPLRGRNLPVGSALADASHQPAKTVSAKADPTGAENSPMSKILVAVSSPWAAEKVAESVADLARRLGAEVLVVHVSRPSSGPMREQEQADGEAAIRS